MLDASRVLYSLIRTKNNLIHSSPTRNKHNVSILLNQLDKREARR